MRVGRLRVHVDIGDVGSRHADVLVRTTGSALVPRRADPVLVAAGPDVAAALRALRLHLPAHAPPPGEAVTTGAGALRATWLVHVVVPHYSARTDQAHLLAASYRAVLREADAVSATTLAMPLLGSTGPYWPLDLATRVCLGTLASTPCALTHVELLVSTPAALEVLAEGLARESG